MSKVVYNQTSKAYLIEIIMLISFGCQLTVGNVPAIIN